MFWSVSLHFWPSVCDHSLINGRLLTSFQSDIARLQMRLMCWYWVMQLISVTPDTSVAGMLRDRSGREVHQLLPGVVADFIVVGLQFLAVSHSWHVQICVIICPWAGVHGVVIFLLYCQPRDLGSNSHMTERYYGISFRLMPPSYKMSALTVRCYWEANTVAKRTGLLPSHAVQEVADWEEPCILVSLN